MRDFVVEEEALVFCSFELGVEHQRDEGLGGAMVVEREEDFNSAEGYKIRVGGKRVGRKNGVVVNGRVIE